MNTRSRYAVVFAALMMSAAPIAGPARGEDGRLELRLVSVSQALSDALRLAAANGQSSLLASVYENSRITPFRAGAIRNEAVRLAPDLEPAITLATDIALHHAKGLPNRSTGFAATKLTRPPGADNDVDLAAIPEFQRNWGVGAIGTQAAADLNLRGKGVVVGVVDSGIDRTSGGGVHSEFAGRLDSRSTSLVHWYDPELAIKAGSVEAGYLRPSTASEDGDGHGTHVAGIIAAAKDGQGMQGVAPGATILSIQALPSIDSDVLEEDGTFQIDGVTYHASALSICGSDVYLTDESKCRPANSIGFGTSNAIAYLATQADVRVINGSFGPDVEAGGTSWATDDLTEEANAVRAALKAGQILTIAAGNERAKAPVYGENPSGIGLFPFINPLNAGTLNSAGDRIYTGSEGVDFSDMTDAGLAAAEKADGIKRGRIIAVVATDSQKVIAEYSNFCGVAAEWCIAAPGGTYDDSVERPIYSTAPNGSYVAMQGTSMAAPHVAGAVAVLIEAFPTYTPAQITNILLETAEDLGAVGTDLVYGRGFLRLDRALDSGSDGLDPLHEGTFVVSADKGDRIIWTKPVESAGVLSKTGEGTLVVLGNANFQRGTSVGGGDLRVDGNLQTPSLLVEAGATLSGNGVITGNVNSRGHLSPGASPGLLTINGDLVLDPLAQTNIEVDGPAADSGAGGFDRILIAGVGRTADLGGTLAPLLRGITGAANNNFTPELGQSFTFLEVQDGEVLGSFDRLLQPTAGLAANTRFDVIYGESSVTLATTPLSYADLQVFGVAQSDAARQIGGAIDALRPVAGVRPGEEVADLFSSLYLGGAAGVSAGLEQATGAIYVDAGQTAVASVGRFADQIWQHQTEMAILGGLSGDQTRFWTEGEKWFADYGSFESNSGSVTFGLDVPMDRGWVGGAIRYEGSDIASGARGSGNVETYHGALYGLADLESAELAGRAGVSFGQLDVSRQISFGSGDLSLLTSDDRGFGGFAEASIQKRLIEGETILIPSMTIGYRAFAFDGATESGSVLPATTSDDTFEEGHATAAVAVSRPFSLAGDMEFIPTAMLGYRRDFIAIDDSASVSVLGTGFTTYGEEIGRDALVGGVKFEIAEGNRFSLAAGYDLDIRKGADRHNFGGSLTLRW
ncbi:S8 family serine peptidase [Rhizobium halophilum]|uniref:S8 family serine peptidase n=1 Tax=Rhizobium halophilum TaxID=2846852 RepID=UPI001EFD39A5|nr:S8 family serine peptidase [Rhizobium halophilum]MCF6368149.1 S8 family serine peptidase [Rhizobium halophilum]